GTVGSAVKAVCDQAGERLFKLAQKVENSPLADARFDEVRFSDGRIGLSGDASRSVSIADAMRHGGGSSMEEEAPASPDERNRSEYGPNSTPAVSAEENVSRAP